MWTNVSVGEAVKMFAKVIVAIVLIMPLLVLLIPAFILLLVEVAWQLIGSLLAIITGTVFDWIINLVDWTQE